jgi:hypothetical protein
MRTAAAPCPSFYRPWVFVKRRTSLTTVAALCLAFIAGMIVLRAVQVFGPTSEAEKERRTFDQAFDITRNRYVESDKTDPADLVHHAIAGMIDGLGDTARTASTSAPASAD